MALLKVYYMANKLKINEEKTTFKVIGTSYRNNRRCFQIKVSEDETIVDS